MNDKRLIKKESKMKELSDMKQNDQLFLQACAGGLINVVDRNLSTVSKRIINAGAGMAIGCGHTKLAKHLIKRGADDYEMLLRMIIQRNLHDMANHMVNVVKYKPLMEHIKLARHKGNQKMVGLLCDDMDPCQAVIALGNQIIQLFEKSATTVIYRTLLQDIDKKRIVPKSFLSITNELFRGKVIRDEINRDRSKNVRDEA